MNPHYYWFYGCFHPVTFKLPLDYQISTKILRKVITSDDEEALLELLEAVKDYPETTRLLEKRLRELR